MLGLILSTFYLVLTFGIKQGLQSDLEAQHEATQLEVKPMPFTSIYWSAIVEKDNSFDIGYRSLWKDDDFIWEENIPKNHELLNQYLSEENIEKLQFLTKGYYAAAKRNDTLFVYDLKFGTLNKLTSGTNKSPLMGYGFVLQQEGVSSMFKLTDIHNLGDANFKSYKNYIF